MLEWLWLMLPVVALAILMLVVGLIAAALVRAVVRRAGERLGLALAGTIADALYWLLVVLTLLAVARHLGLRVEMVERLILIGFTAGAAAAALAFGLGGRELAANVMAGYALRQRLQPGDEVQVSGIEGTVREVGPVSTTLETEEKGLLHRHVVPNGVMLNEAVR